MKIGDNKLQMHKMSRYVIHVQIFAKPWLPVQDSKVEMYSLFERDYFSIYSIPLKRRGKVIIQVPVTLR